MAEQCVSCKQPLPDEHRVTFPTLCDDCVKLQADWFWDIWRQARREDEAAGAQPPA